MVAWQPHPEGLVFGPSPFELKITTLQGIVLLQDVPLSLSAPTTVLGVALEGAHTKAFKQH